ncbi:MAG: DUF1810 domain-containing protein [Desulfovibrio sp.]|nr:DUF1810 domain-containing protein [Desulfovibrio sp.]
MSRDLERFLQAQEHVYADALREIRNGEKQSHWMWFIFPQIRGLGRSSMAEYFGIKDIDEARAYLCHPILALRLREISGELLHLKERDPKRIFGPLDAMKLRSCMTLFDIAEEEGNQKPSVFKQVLDQYYGGEPDAATLRILAERKQARNNSL